VLGWALSDLGTGFAGYGLVWEFAWLGMTRYGRGLGCVWSSMGWVGNVLCWELACPFMGRSWAGHWLGWEWAGLDWSGRGLGWARPWLDIVWTGHGIICAWAGLCTALARHGLR
jgi:hypothetical protein